VFLSVLPTSEGEMVSLLPWLYRQKGAIRESLKDMVLKIDFWFFNIAVWSAWVYTVCDGI